MACKSAKRKSQTKSKSKTRAKSSRARTKLARQGGVATLL